MIEAGLVSRLKSSADLVTLVEDRFFPLRAPQDETRPRITYQRIDTIREKHLRGTSGLTHPRIQVNCFADNYGTVKRMADYVRRQLDGFSGPAGAFTVHATWVDSDRDDWFPPEDATDAGTYRTSVDVIIWFSE
jgi:hypothetical protein